MRVLYTVAAASAFLVAKALPNTKSSDLRPVGDAMGCGSHTAPDLEVERNIASKIGEVQSRLATARTSNTYAVATKNVPVYWHVIRKDTSVSGGNVPDSAITSSINELNTRYSSSGFNFVLQSTDRTTNQNWFDYAGPQTSQNTAMKRSLRRGGVESLNIYSVGFTSISQQGLLGFAAFPQNAPSNLVEDGIVFLHTTVPGGSIGSNYNQGKVLSHEAGHWLGLYHTFQNSVSGASGCVADGDFVSDTNKEADATFGCPASRDSCPNDAGNDNIANIMNYTYDYCKGQVTAGQTARMVALCERYRNL
ncbi:hypothetical protein OIO90_003487 [Microbotryomycetes sp. JL221]|nr:hypothetical protein OIO90_003487 [Microbotryomycetes sp. JL221]